MPARVRYAMDKQKQWSGGAAGAYWEWIAMDQKQPFVQCVYRSKRQFEQHAVLMLENGYTIHALNGLRPRVEVDRAAVRAFLAADVIHAYGSQLGGFSVTYRLAAVAVPA